MCELKVNMFELQSKYNGNTINKKGCCKICGYNRSEYHAIRSRIMDKLEAENKPINENTINKAFAEHLKYKEYNKTPLERK